MGENTTGRQIAGTLKQWAGQTTTTKDNDMIKSNGTYILYIIYLIFIYQICKEN